MKDNHGPLGFTLRRGPFGLELMAERSGFTLIEMLVVIAILAILAASITIYLSHYQARSRDAARISDVQKLQDAVEFYIEDNGTPPPITNWSGFLASIGQYFKGPLSQNSQDYPYGYCRDSQNPDLYLVGALMEIEDEIKGDLDGSQANYTCGECVYDDGICNNPPNCDDYDTGYFRNNYGTVLCLGRANN